MPKPRTGSVYRDKKRKAWIARLDWQDPSGRRQCRKRQVGSKSDGNALVKQWIRDLEESCLPEDFRPPTEPAILSSSIGNQFTSFGSSGPV